MRLSIKAIVRHPIVREEAQLSLNMMLRHSQFLKAYRLLLACTASKIFS